MQFTDLESNLIDLIFSLVLSSRNEIIRYELNDLEIKKTLGVGAFGRVISMIILNMMMILS